MEVSPAGAGGASVHQLTLLLPAATKREPGDAEAQRHRTGRHVPVQAPQRVPVQQRAVSEAHQ